MCGRQRSYERIFPLDFARGKDLLKRKELARWNVQTLECWGRSTPHPRGFCMDVQRKELREEGFVSL
jgi:hypothetical protein